MDNDRLAQFRGQRYLNLETVRRNGDAVRTPLWFVELDGALYVRTPENSGKVKRLRHTSRVRVVPCNMRGGPKGEWVAATAHFVDGEAAEPINELLKKKYGLAKALIDFGAKLRRRKSVVIGLRV